MTAGAVPSIPITDPVRFIPSTLTREALAEIIPDALYLVTDANAVRAEPFLRFGKGASPRLLILLQIGGADFILTEDTAVAVGKALAAGPTRCGQLEDAMRTAVAAKLSQAILCGRYVMAFLLRGAH